jgi:protein phosphatase 2C
MEDAYTAVPFLLEVPVPADLSPAADILPPRIATQVRSASTSPNASDGEGGHTPAAVSEKEAAEQRFHSGLDVSTSKDVQEEPAPYMETLHFFGVFDGHGGAEAALHCAQTLHQRIAEALAAATDPSSTLDEDMPEEEGAPDDPPDVAREPSGLPEGVQHVSLTEEAEGSLALASISDEELMDFEDPSEGRLEGVTCTSASFQSALTSAFNRTDEEFGKADNAALVGTTAVVTLVGSRQLYVANCGDSRAVLCRAGLAIPLTDDHKAAREDETARVEAAGGQILFWNGVRVMGVLAVSRAIGDHCLRPYVIAQPEVTILGRRQDDELLLLASDGLWDVLSNQEACTLAKRCLRRARQRGASRQSAARIAATVLTRAAVDRGSRDNVTVLVVDLSSGAADQEAMTRTPSAALADDVTDHLHDQDPEEPMARAQSRPLGSHR